MNRTSRRGQVKAALGGSARTAGLSPELRASGIRFGVNVIDAAVVLPRTGTVKSIFPIKIRVQSGSGSEE